MYPGYGIKNLQNEDENEFFECYEWEWLKAKPGLYYGLTKCNDQPGSKFYSEPELHDAIRQFFLFFHTFPQMTFALGFPLIEFQGQIPNKHTVSFCSWSLFAVNWFNYYDCAVNQPDQSLITHPGRRILRPFQAITRNYPGIQEEDKYDIKRREKSRRANIIFRHLLIKGERETTSHEQALNEYPAASTPLDVHSKGKRRASLSWEQK